MLASGYKAQVVPFPSPPKLEPWVTKRLPERSGPSAVGSYLPRIARAAFERHGFANASILSDWPLIAGEETASYTAPERLIWPRRGPDVSGIAPTSAGHRRPSGATLVLRVDGPRAIEVQHAAPRIIESVNSYFGYRAVADLRIVQGPVIRRSRPLPPAPENDAQELDGLERISDGALRKALARLKARVS